MTHVCFQPRNSRASPRREYNSRQGARPIHPFGLKASHCFRRGCVFWRQPERQRDRTALPGRRTRTSCTHPPVLAFAKIIAREFLRLPPLEFSAIYLQPTPPLRRLNHASDTDAPGTNPAAVAVPALVSTFVLRVPWVSSFHCMAITFLGGAVRPSYSTAPVTC